MLPKYIKQKGSRYNILLERNTRKVIYIYLSVQEDILRDTRDKKMDAQVMIEMGRLEKEQKKTFHSIFQLYLWMWLLCKCIHSMY